MFIETMDLMSNPNDNYHHKR